MTKNKILYFFKTYWRTVAWAFVIAFLSLTAGSNLPKLNWELLSPDKFGHFTVYSLLAFLGLYDVTKSKIAFSFYTYIYVWLAATAFGFAMEWSQYFFTPDRCFEYPDMLANALGALLGVLAFRFAIGSKN